MVDGMSNWPTGWGTDWLVRWGMTGDFFSMQFIRAHNLKLGIFAECYRIYVHAIYINYIITTTKTKKS